ncbi:MAG: efflux RND transporter periplasmic adaptor subunit [Verrucomicrobia bacterium]|nr:efflux RND transporter periplasmic adaptor subunit [Verrucomicrobiota bacterium]
MKTFLTIFLTTIFTVSATWLALRKYNLAPVPAAAKGEHKVLFYQCAMHPQVTSDRPGRCTICGMELTPINEGGTASMESGGGNPVTLTQNQIQVLHVQTAAAKTRPLVRTLRVSGNIAENSMRHRVLSSYVEGRIDKLHVNYIGAEVLENQPLAEFYSPTLLQAEREYRQLGGELRNNTALRLRQMGLTSAQIEGLEHKPVDLLTSQILSPISGTVVAQAVYEGQYVGAGERLFELADFSTMWFMFRAYEQDMPWIKPGLSVSVTTPSLPEKTFAGKITFIDPNFDEATRSTNVRVALPNPIVNGKRELLNRLYADGMVELEAPSVLTVPRSAVIETGPEAVVYIDQNGGGYAHTVLQTGRRGDTHVEVLSGLKEGDAVVTNGNLLIDGQAEMNRAFMTPAAPVVVAATQTDLSEAQQKSITAFIKVADAMAAALGADDLTSFNTASAPAMTTTEAMVELLRPNMKNLDDLDKARHFHGYQELKSARVAFHPFSVAATAALAPLRKTRGMPDFQVYECGMVNQAIPGAPKKARWIQTGGREMRNPFFGKEMADCGEEIKP